MKWEEYSKKVMEHFKNPKNMGDMKDPDGVARVGNPQCLVPGTKVQTNPNIENIETLSGGKRILSHDGNFHEVKKTMNRKYTGEVVTIKSRLGGFTLTPDHEVLSMKIPEGDKFLRTKNKVTLIPDWNHASELKRRDILLYPIPKYSQDKEKISIPSQKKKYDFRSKDVPREIKCDKEFLRLAGYFVAEGHTRIKTCKTMFGLAFNSGEIDYIKDVRNIIRKIFGLEPKIKFEHHKKTARIEVNNVFLARLFRDMFGCGAAEKKIPAFMMLLPKEKQAAILCGLWRGDGFVNTKIPRAGYATISYELVQQIKILLMRQGIVPSIYSEEEKTVDGVSHKKSYRIHIGGLENVKKIANIVGRKIDESKSSPLRTWADENYVYVPVMSASKEQYTGLVYNLGVEGSASYTTDAATVHNCGDIMEMQIKVEKGKIKDIKFKTFGCVAAIATSSMATEMVKGQPLEEAEKLTDKAVAEALHGLPPVKMHCSNLAATAIKKAINDYKKKQGMPYEEIKEHEHEEDKSTKKD